MISDLFSEIPFCRRITVNYLSAAKYLGCNDKTRRYRQTVIFQLKYVKPFIAQMNQTENLAVFPVHRHHGSLGIIVKEEVEPVFGEFV